MGSYTVDCANLKDESAFWQAYLAVTKPEGAGYFGCNLDAFWDALNGGPGWPGECQLKFVNTASLKTLREGRFYQALQEIARDSELVEVHLE
jgi:RNAse (barnase) inhibitor barstar